MFIKKLTLIGAAICGLGAQIAWTPLTANVPFNFEATGVKLEAGKYEVLRTGHGYLFALRSKSTGKTIMMSGGAANDNKRNRTSLEFKRHGDSYFLTAIEIGSLGQKISIPSGRHEKEWALTSRPETVIAIAE